MEAMEYVVISAAIALATCLFVIVICVTRPKRRINVCAPEEALQHEGKFKLLLKSELNKESKSHIEIALSDYVNFVKDNSNCLVVDQDLVNEARSCIKTHTKSTYSLNRQHAKLTKDLKRALDEGVRKKVQDSYQTLKDFENCNCGVVKPDKSVLLKAEVYIRRQRSIRASVTPTETMLSRKLRYAISSKKFMIIQDALNEYEDFVKEHGISTPDHKLIGDAKDFLVKQGDASLELKQELEELVQRLEKALNSGHLQNTERALVKYNLFCKLHESEVMCKSRLVDRAEAMIREKQQVVNNGRAQHNVLHENLRSAVGSHDPSALRDAVQRYEEFVTANVGLFNSDDELVAVARNFVHTWEEELLETAAKDAKEARERAQTVVTTRQSIREPVGMDVVRKLDERKQRLYEAVEMRDLSGIQKSLQKYEDFIKKNKPAIVGDKKLIGDSRKLLQQLENRKALIDAIEEKNEKRLKAALSKIEDPSFDRTTVPEYYLGKRLNEDLEYTENLKQVIFKLDKDAMSKVSEIEDPPEHLVDTMRATLLVLGDAETETCDWDSCKKMFSTVRTQEYEGIIRRIKHFKHKNVHPEIAARANEMLIRHTKRKLESTGAAAFAFYYWAQSVCELCLSRCEEPPTAATGDRQAECLSQRQSLGKVEIGHVAKKSVTKQGSIVE